MESTWAVEAILIRNETPMDRIRQTEGERLSRSISRWFPLSEGAHVELRVRHSPTGRVRVAKVTSFRRPATILVRWGKNVMKVGIAVNVLKKELERFEVNGA